MIFNSILLLLIKNIDKQQLSCIIFFNYSALGVVGECVYNEYLELHLLIHAVGQRLIYR